MHVNDRAPGEGLLREAKAEALRKGETVTALIERGLRLVLAGGRAEGVAPGSHYPYRAPRAARSPASTSTTKRPPQSARRALMILPTSTFVVCLPPRRRASRRLSLVAREVVNGEAAYSISPQVLASVIRIGTHRRIYVHPSTMPEALAFCDALLQPRHCTVVQPGPRHWGIFTNLCRKSRATGNLVQDAWHAALAIESGSEWVTTDRDYARFPGLRWREPF